MLCGDCIDVLCVQARFVELLSCFRVEEPFPPEKFMLDDDILARLCEDLPYKLDRAPPKRSKEELGWKMTHESLCLERGLIWPRDIADQCFRGFREREAELVSMTNKLFPNAPEDCPEGGWHFFDANHTAERTFRTDSEAFREKGLLSNFNFLATQT